MNKLFKILKINIINSFKFKTYSKKKKVLIGIFAFYIIGSIMVSISMLLNEIFKTLQSVNLITYFIPILFSLSSLFAFIFSIYSAKASLFENKDNDLLFSLPLKKEIIVLSRFLYLVLFNFVISFIFILPGLFIYLNNVSVTIEFYFLMLFMIILLPIIPTVLASLFGYIIALLISKAKHKNIFEFIYYCLFIIVYILLMSKGNEIFILLVNNVTFMNKILKIFFLPIFLITKGINTSNLLYLLYYILINGIVLYLFTIILNRNYYKLISKLSAFHTKSNYHMTSLITASKTKALYKKEFKRYFSSPIYVFNTIFGVLVIIGVGVASLFYSKEQILSLIDVNFNFDTSILILYLLLFAISMTNTTCSSISIEGKNFWILKMLPVKTKDIFKSKLFVNKIVIIPITILSLILFSLSGFISYKEFLLLTIFVVFYSYFIANFGLIANLLLPKFDALNDTVVVKQSASTMLGILVPVVISIIVIGLSYFTINNIIVLVIAIIISFILSFITNIIINTWGVKRFNKLS